MNLKPYPKYKESGIEWLGKIPEGWEVKRLKYICNEYAEYGLNIEAENYQSEGIRFIRTTDLDDYGNLKNEGVYINPILAKNYILKDGDLLISRSGTIGRSFLYESSKNEEATYAGYLVRYSPDSEKVSPKYLFYFTLSHSFYEWLKTQLVESTIGNVNGQKYANIFLTIPPKEEQIRLSAFLDRKTAKVDELIKKNEQLIELLKEKRQAVISHAVTKGIPSHSSLEKIPPSPPFIKGELGGLKMKDSGIEWLGEIPQGWSVKRLKYVCTKYAEYGLNIEAANYQPEGIRFIRTTDLDDFGNLQEEGVYINPTLAKDYILKDGDLLISRSGTIGRSFLYELRKNGETTYAGYLVRYCPDLKKVFPKYLFYFTLSHSFYEWLKTQLIETTIGNVNGQKYANMFLPIPPKEEQIRLSAFLDHRTAKIDESINKVQSQITALKEYRQALISNVVTGKVRVL